MSITGKMLQSTVFGPHLEMKRTIFEMLKHFGPTDPEWVRWYENQLNRPTDAQ